MKRLAAWLSISLCAWFGVQSARGEGREASVLYPPRADALVFEHETDAHRQLTCDHCHRPRATRSDDLRPSEADCASCHADRIDRSQTSSERCGYCHRGFDLAHPQAPAPIALPSSRLRFDHTKHTNVKCSTCHAGGDGASSLPSMASCLKCHAADAARPLPCNGCHLALPSGRLRTHFDDAKLIPRSGYLGMAHDADFYVRHRWIAADRGAVCATCHVESECTACHDGRRKPRGVHPNDYLSLHAQDSQRNATRCASCHDSPSFCLPCHARLGISEISAPDVHAPRRFHPASSVWIRGPVLHAREAQRSLSSCVSCHAERDCVQCHGAPGIGTGLHSPHPAGFDAQCGEALAHNARACGMCHRASDPLFRTCR